MRGKFTLTVLVLSLLGSGCALIGDGIHMVKTDCADSVDDCLERIRNRHWAEAAWKTAQECDRQERSADYARGFKDGFREYVYSGQAEPPPVPPAQYRRFRYQNPQGYRAIEDWFAGYGRGVAVAIEAGCRRCITGPVLGAHQPIIKEGALVDTRRPPFLPSSGWTGPVSQSLQPTPAIQGRAGLGTPRLQEVRAGDEVTSLERYLFSGRPVATLAAPKDILPHPGLGLPTVEVSDTMADIIQASPLLHLVFYYPPTGAEPPLIHKARPGSFLGIPTSDDEEPIAPDPPTPPLPGVIFLRPALERNSIVIEERLPQSIFGLPTPVEETATPIREALPLRALVFPDLIDEVTQVDVKDASPPLDQEFPSRAADDTAVAEAAPLRGLFSADLLDDERKPAVEDLVPMSSLGVPTVPADPNRRSLKDKTSPPPSFGLPRAQQAEDDPKKSVARENAAALTEAARAKEAKVSRPVGSVAGDILTLPPLCRTHGEGHAPPLKLLPAATASTVPSGNDDILTLPARRSSAQAAPADAVGPWPRLGNIRTMDPR